MQYRHELVRLEDGMSTKVFVHSVLDVIPHWHNEIELLMVLAGTVELKKENQQITLNHHDICLINQNELHSMRGSSDNVLLAIQFPTTLLSKSYPELDNIVFDLCSATSSQNKGGIYDVVRHHLAKIAWEFSRQQRWFKLAIERELYALICSLTKYARYETSPFNPLNREKDLQRLTRIIELIESNYQYKVQLQEIADSECISLYHLSRFFKEKMGTSFQEYLFEYRTYKAAQQLSQSSENIADIAFSSGFNDIKLFYKKFKQRYNQTPAEFRKQLIHSSQVVSPSQPSYMNIDNQSAYTALFEFLHQQEKSTSHLVLLDKAHVIAIPSDIASSKELKTPAWGNLMTFGCAHEALNAQVQQQMALTQRELGFNYVRFQGIFNEQMQIVCSDGTFSWDRVDVLIDFLISINLKPFFCLGYMPEHLATTSLTVAHWKGYVSPPSSLEKWKQFVQSFLNHLISRYGEEEVSEWFFEVWNEPDFEGIFWDGNKERYFELYEATYQAVRSVSSALRIGGPSVSHLAIDNSNWLKKFIEYCVRYNLQPDFFSFHVYPEHYDSIFENYHAKSNSTLNTLDSARRVTMSLSGCQDITTRMIETLSPLSTREYHVTEWNLSACWGNVVLDTAYVGSFIVYNAIHLWEQVKSLGFWTFSDLFEERGPSQGTFHGGFGMLTKEGIKKPSFHALSLLNRLGDTLVNLADDYIVTRSKNQLQILMVNYIHFDPLYSNGDISAVQTSDPYLAFNDANARRFSFELDLPVESIKMVSYTLNRDHGSPYDIWRDIGAPQPLTRDDIEDIERLNRPKRKVHQSIALDGGKFAVSRDVQPHGVELITIDYSGQIKSTI